MIYVIEAECKLSALSHSEYHKLDHDSEAYKTAKSRWNWTSYEEVCQLAERLTVDTGVTYLGIDSGEHTSSRFDVIEAPKVGDDVSQTFNGDSYYCGKITKIGKNFKTIYTDQGHKFNRRRMSGGWRHSGGTFWMVRGVHNERNPEF